MERVCVIGTSGSGKTTLAVALAGVLQCPHIELDALHWEPGWRPVAADLFRDRVTRAVDAERWVADGNYSSVRHLVWSRADTIIWLDYALAVVFVRVLGRTARRIVFGELVCNGNRESLRMALSRDSIIVWALTTYARRRRQYPVLLGEVASRGVAVVRLTSPRAASTWLAEAARVGRESRPN